MHGSVELVSFMQRVPLIALFDRDPLPLEVVAALSARYAPPRLTTTTGELLVVCCCQCQSKRAQKI